MLQLLSIVSPTWNKFFGEESYDFSYNSDQNSEVQVAELGFLVKKPFKIKIVELQTQQ